MTIHENLRQLRLQRGLTQEQVAGQLNVTRQALSSYESGRTRPDIDTLMKLAAIHETDLEGILYGTDGRLAWSSRVRKTAKILLFLLPALTSFRAMCRLFLCLLLDGLIGRLQKTNVNETCGLLLQAAFRLSATFHETVN